MPTSDIDKVDGVSLSSMKGASSVTEDRPVEQSVTFVEKYIDVSGGGSSPGVQINLILHVGSSSKIQFIGSTDRMLQV